MLVPNLFRWLFFRKNKKSITNTFDALRHENTVYADVSVHFGGNQATFDNSQPLSDKNLTEFAHTYAKETPVVLFGNSKNNLNHIHTQLEKYGFLYVYNVGSLEDLINIKKSLK